MARPKPLEATIPLTISVPLSLKAAFVQRCKNADQQASQILRAAMRTYIAQQKAKVSSDA